jgi:signal transduction histidine kinase
MFEQLDRDSDGSGIGLALVKRIIESHGGKVWVESQGQDKGSAFYFTLGEVSIAMGA